MKKLVFMAAMCAAMVGCNGGGNTAVEKENGTVSGGENGAVEKKEAVAESKETKSVSAAKAKVMEGDFMSIAYVEENGAVIWADIEDGKIKISKEKQSIGGNSETVWAYEGKYSVAPTSGESGVEGISLKGTEIACKLKKAGVGNEFDARLRIDSVGKNHTKLCFLHLDCAASEPISKYDDSCIDLHRVSYNDGTEFDALYSKGNLQTYIEDLYAITWDVHLLELAKYMENPKEGCDKCKATVDLKGGYARYDCEFTAGSNAVVCYWNVEGGVLLGYTHCAETQCSFKFFKYDKKDGTYEYKKMLAGIDEGDDVFVELPRKGKDVKVTYEDGREVVYKWNGKGFDRK